MLPLLSVPVNSLIILKILHLSPLITPLVGMIFIILALRGILRLLASPAWISLVRGIVRPGEQQGERSHAAD